MQEYTWLKKYAWEWASSWTCQYTVLCLFGWCQTIIEIWILRLTLILRLILTLLTLLTLTVTLYALIILLSSINLERSRQFTVYGLPSTTVSQIIDVVLLITVAHRAMCCCIGHGCYISDPNPVVSQAQRTLLGLCCFMPGRQDNVGTADAGTMLGRRNNARML